MPNDAASFSVNPRKRLTALDGLRTIAVLLVFVHHVDQRAFPGGFIGVDLFFAISGFLITSLLLRERKATGSVSLSRFYMRRLLRLYPALVVLVLVVTPLAMLFDIGRPIPDGLAALAYLTDFWSNAFPHGSLLLHTWSLSVEEQFYLVWPIILLFVLRREYNLAPVVVGAAILSVPVTFAIHSAHLYRLALVGFLPTSHLVALAAGILLAVGIDRQPHRWLLRLSGAAFALAGLASLVIALFVLPGEWWAFPLGGILCWPIVAHVVLHRTSWISAALRFRPLTWLGERSYAFYLWHYPIILVLDRQPTWSRLEVAALALTLTLAVTAVSWRFVEAPFLRLKDRFESGEPPSKSQ